jgi:hypothetical protein
VSKTSKRMKAKKTSKRMKMRKRNRKQTFKLDCGLWYCTME